MSEFERAMRDAVDTTAAETALPPFERLARTHRRRRATRLTAVGVAAAAALGGIAVAGPGRDTGGIAPAATVTPSGTPSPSSTLKPFWDLRKDFPARVAIRQCIEDAGGPVPMPGGMAHGLWIIDGSWKTSEFDPEFRDLPEIMDRCLVQGGYEAYAVQYDAPRRADDRVALACADTARTKVVRSGTLQGKEWVVRAYQAEGRICLRSGWGEWRTRYVRRLNEMEWGSFHREPFVPGALDMLVWGYAHPDVARVEVTADGESTATDVVRIEGIDRPLYAMHVRFRPGGEKRMTFTQFDAEGRPFAEPTPSPGERVVPSGGPTMPPPPPP